MRTDDTIDHAKASEAILNVCNDYMKKNKTIIAQQELIWGLVNNLSIVIAVSQPPDFIMSDIMSIISNAPKRDVRDYTVIDPRGLQ